MFKIPRKIREFRSFDLPSTPLRTVMIGTQYALFEDALSLRIQTMNPGETIALAGNIFEGACSLEANDGNATVESSSNVFRTQDAVMMLSGNRGHVLSVVSVADAFVSTAAHYNKSGEVFVSSPQMQLITDT